MSKHIVLCDTVSTGAQAEVSVGKSGHPAENKTALLLVEGGGAANYDIDIEGKTISADGYTVLKNLTQADDSAWECVIAPLMRVTTRAVAGTSRPRGHLMCAPPARATDISYERLK